LEGLCEQIEGSVLLCGELDGSDTEMIHDRLGDSATVASPASSLRRAGYLAELAWARLAQGDVDDAATLAPIYLHEL
jgi:tRNA threonylcarbamoyladenosine biosynthesis protein TsaB